MLAAQRNITVISTDFDRGTFLNGIPILVNSKVHARFSATCADRFQFIHFIGECQKPFASFKQVGLKIGSEAVSKVPVF